MSIAVYFYDSNAVKTKEGLLTLDSGTGKYTYSNEQAQINQGDIDTNELCIVMPDALFDRADTGCFVSFVSPVRNPLGLIPGSWETRTIIIDTVETAYLNCAIIPLDLAFYTYVAGRYGFAGGFVNSSTGSIKKTVLGNYTVQNGVDNFTENELTASDYDNLLTAITNLTSGFGGRIADVEDYVAGIIAGTQLLEKIALDTVSPPETLNVGETRWNVTVKTPETKLNSEVTLQHGQELLAYLRNSESTTITNGTVVYVYEGTVGGSTHALMKRATTADLTAYKMIGVATQDITANNYGFITLYGGMNLTTGHGFSAGDVLYLGVDGALTSTMPTAPTPRVKIGIVEPGDRLLVIPHIHYTLGMSSDVLISGQDNLSIIVWNATDARWQNTTKATFLSDCVQLSTVNNFTNTNYFSSGLYNIKIEPTTGAIEIYYISNLWAKIDKNGVYLNPTYVTSAASDNYVPTKGFVDSYISTHNLSSISHNNLLLAIQTLQQEVARLDGRGKSYGEIAYTNATLTAMDTATRNSTINAAIVAGYGGVGYTPTLTDLVYDTGIGDGVQYHEWEFNGTNWVDNGEFTNALASDSVFGLVKGNEYISIISGLMQVLLADNATRLKDSGSANYYTYATIYDAINTLTSNIATIDDANLNESHSRMSPALLGTITDGTPVSDAYWNGRLNEIRLKGLTVPQLIKNGNFVTTGNWTADASTFTVSSNVANVTATAQFGSIYQQFTIISGHKYAVIFDYQTASSNIKLLERITSASSVSVALTATTGYLRHASVYTADRSATTARIYFSDFSASGFALFNVKNVMLFDLTALGTHPTLGVAWSTLSASVVASYIGAYKTNAEIVAEQTTNLVTNGTFDSATTGWSSVVSTGTLSVVSSQLRHTISNVQAYAGVQTSVTITAGRTYLLTYDMTAFRTHTAQVYLGAGAAVNVGTVTAGVKTSLSWTFVASASGTVIYLYDNGSTATGMSIGSTTDYDNVVLYDITDSARTSGVYSFTPALITSTDGTITRTLDLSSIGSLSSLPSGIKDEFDTYVSTSTGERVHEFARRTTRITLPNNTGWVAGAVGASFTQFYINLASYDNGYTLSLPGDDTDLPDAFQSINYVPTAFTDFQTLAPETPTVAGSCITPGGYYHLVLPNATADTIGELYTYLASNPIFIIIAVTSTTETSVIGYLKQTGLPMTIDVTSDTFVNESAFSVKYVKDTETIIDNRSDLIEADIEVAQADILNNELAIANHEQRLDETEETLRKNLSADGLATTDDDGMGVIALSKDVAPAPLKVQVDGLLLDAPQLLSNPTFDTVTTGWTAQNASHAISSGVLVNTASGADVYGREYQITATPVSIAAKIYGIIKLRITNALCASFNATIDGSTAGAEQAVFSQATPANGTWYTLSGIATEAADFTGFLQLKISHVYANTTNATGAIMEVDYAYLFNISTLITNKQYSPLYSTTFDLMSDAQIKAQMDSWVIDGTLPSSINAVNMNKRLRATGKNLVKFDDYEQGDLTSLGIETASTARVRTKYIKAKLSTAYIVKSTSATYGIGTVHFYDIDKIFISRNTTSGQSISFTTPSNCFYIRFTVGIATAYTANLIPNDVITAQVQLELGSTATTYAPYQDSDIYLQADEVGYSLPNAVKDSIEMRDGKAYYVKRVQKYALQSADITALITTGINVDRVSTSAISDIYYSATLTDTAYISELIQTSANTFADTTAFINKFYISSDGTLRVIVAKATYANLAAAQSALAGTVVYYQLATPITTEIKSSGVLNGFPSGHVYIDDIIKDQDIYTTAISVTDTNYPIVTIAEIMKINTDGTTTSLAVSGATIASGGLSFTHTSLTAGDIVVFTYYYGTGLRGLTTVTYYPSLEDLRFPVTVFKQGATTKPDFDYTNIGLLFPQNDATEIAYIVAQLPHDRIQDSDIVPHVHVRLTGANQPVMKMDYKWYNIDEAPAAGFTTYIMNVNSSAWASGTKAVIISGAAAISGVGKTDSSILIIKLYRDDNVYVGDLLVDEFDIHYYKSR